MDSPNLYPLWSCPLLAVDACARPASQSPGSRSASCVIDFVNLEALDATKNVSSSGLLSYQMSASPVQKIEWRGFLVEICFPVLFSDRSFFNQVEQKIVGAPTKNGRIL